MITRLEAYAAVLGILAIVLLGMGMAIHHYKSELGIVQAQYDGFKQTVEAKGKQAEAEKKLKEQQDAKRIDDAVAGRDDAIKRLQLAQAAANARFRAVSSNPSAPAGSKQVCFDSASYNAAFQQFGAGINRFLQAATGFAYEGDSAALDAKTLIQAWPAR